MFKPEYKIHGQSTLQARRKPARQTVLKPVAAALMLAMSGAASAASDADLAAIRAQIAEIKQSYEARIVALEKKLAEAESRMPAAAASPVVAGAAPGRAPGGAPTVAPARWPTAEAGAMQTAAGKGPSLEASLILQGQYKQMKNLAERGITGFVPAGGHAHAAGTVEGINRRGFGIDHSELILSANIDPYWRGQAILAALDGKAEVEEAWFQSLAIGQGVGLKAGRFRSGLGYLNEQHPHAWDFADAPLMYRALFGEHGSYLQDGVQLKWLAPTETFVEFGAEVGRGANFPGTDRNRNGSGATTLFAHVGGDVGIAHNWRAGLSWLQTRAKARSAHFAGTLDDEVEGLFDGKSQTWVADFVWKWAPDGNPKYRNFKLQTEYFQRKESGGLTCATPEDAAVSVQCDGARSDYRTRQSGWYAQGVYQFLPNWRAGLRYEQLDSGRRDFGDNAAFMVVDSYRPKRASAMVDYSWSEFSRVRLQFAQDQSMQGLHEPQWTLQYIMSLGAHGAHKY